MSEFKTDSTGQILGVRHHDGRICSITFGANRQISLGIRNSAGVDVNVQLFEVGYSVMNEVRDNIIDRMYLWPLNQAPQASVQRMLQALQIDSIELLRQKFGPKAQIFHVDCSYGAQIFALVGQIRIDVATA
jgi:hypothetical protein